MRHHVGDSRHHEVREPTQSATASSHRAGVAFSAVLRFEQAGEKRGLPASRPIPAVQRHGSAGSTISLRIRRPGAGTCLGAGVQTAEEGPYQRARGG